MCGLSASQMAPHDLGGVTAQGHEFIGRVTSVIGVIPIIIAQIISSIARFNGPSAQIFDVAHKVRNFGVSGVPCVTLRTLSKGWLCQKKSHVPENTVAERVLKSVVGSRRRVGGAS